MRAGNAWTSWQALVQRCRELGWEVNASLQCSDDPGSVRSQLRELADSRRVDVLLTTGGTGLGPRDNTPEATLEIAERNIPGLAEEIRQGRGENADGAIVAGRCGNASPDSDLNLPAARKARWNR